jgi:hypothetical protein
MYESNWRALPLLGRTHPPSSGECADLKTPLPERREFERLELPASAFAVDAHGNDLGRIQDIGGGGFLLNPASPWARVHLAKAQQLVVTVVEPTTGNQTDMAVEVCYIRSCTIGLRFL